MDNCSTTTKKLLGALNVQYTNLYLEDAILSHPDHPSLLSISDTLEKYKIKNLAIKIDDNKIDQLPLPCIVQILNGGNSLFYVLADITDEKVAFFTNKSKLQYISRKKFLDIWTRVCLLVEVSDESKEIDIDRKIFAKRILMGLKIALPSLLLIWAVLGFSKAEIIGDSQTAIYAILFTILKIGGLTVGALLLWFEVDQYNPVLQNFCSGSSGDKVNCDSVLNSKYAKFLNGNLSLSLVGFSYFFATLGYLVLNTFSYPSLSLLSYISILTLPIILLSLYYQGGVIRQWCKFCILIQATLVLEILVVFLGGFYKETIAPETIPLFFALLLLPILFWKLTKPLIEKGKEINLYKRGLKRIKNNSNVLEGLLSKSRKISNSTKGLGISINSPTAKYDVIKVCNPYCGPCAKAHPILEELVDNGKINLQILFTTREDGNDHLTNPVKHFLAIDDQGDKNKTQAALHNWYSADKKDYGNFSQNYPMNGELEKQSKKLKLMRSWCEKETITYTPTIFINGYELPKEYSVEDLKEVLA